MAGEREQLRATVQQLLTELPEVHELDPAAAERLRTVLSDVQRMLGEPTVAASTAPAPPAEMTDADSAGDDADSDQQPELAHRLHAAGSPFQQSHPQVWEAIGNIAGMLGQMGF